MFKDLIQKNCFEPVYNVPCSCYVIQTNTTESSHLIICTGRVSLRILAKGDQNEM